MDGSKWYLWDFDSFNFIATNANGRCQHNNGGVLGVGATHLVRCKVYWRYLGFCFKVYLFGL